MFFKSLQNTRILGRSVGFDFFSFQSKIVFNVVYVAVAVIFYNAIEIGMAYHQKALIYV
jgi:hypothetical protein